MNPAPPPDLLPSGEPNAATLFPAGWLQRLWFLWAAVALPVLGLAIAVTDLAKPDWQRPDAAAWIQLMLSRPGIGPFAPLILAAVAVNLAVFLRPAAWVASAWARAALALGFLVALPFSILLPASLFLDSPWAEIKPGRWLSLAFFVVAAYGATFGAAAAFRYLWKRLKPIPLMLVGGLAVMVCMGVCSYLLPHGPTETAAQRLGQGWLGLFVVGPLLTLFAGPVWTADALGRLQWNLGRPRRWPLPQFLAAAAAYLLAWRLAVGRAAEAYENLPKVDTNCFVATAAARGPRWLTGSFDGRAEHGGMVAISPQLQRFKLFELALRELSPAGHRALRRVYDRVGPAIAARAATPGRAALLWLALRPGELLAVVLLRSLAGREIARRATLLYRRREASPRSGGS